MLTAAPHCDPQGIEDTIAAIAVAGRIIDELRARLAAAEGKVSRLEGEKRALSDALCAAAAISRPEASSAPAGGGPAARYPARDDAADGDVLRSFIRSVDASFFRAGACH